MSEPEIEAAGIVEIIPDPLAVEFCGCLRQFKFKDVMLEVMASFLGRSCWLLGVGSEKQRFGCGFVVEPFYLLLLRIK